MGVTVADVVRQYGQSYLTDSGDFRAERKILFDIARCRTAELGGHRYRCKGCGKEEIAYNSCRNRHCPQCLGSKTAKWLQARVSELLPVSYYHCVFTLPFELRGLVLSNRRIAFDLLFKAAAETLKEVASDSKHLGAEIGFFGVLHTWTQTLEFHPHIHFVVHGGGLRQGKWIEKKGKKFFLPVKVLSRVFRGKYIYYLKQAYRRGELKSEDFEHTINRSCSSDWVVYCKPPFAGPGAVLKYLSRYTHRIAISNRRIISLKNGLISFKARSRRQSTASRIVKIPATEFLRRFLLHRVPYRFTRIRHFGLFSNNGRQRVVEKLKRLLKALASVKLPVFRPWLVCTCGAANWLLVEEITYLNSS